jgi:putative superfamily III holin-X
MDLEDTREPLTHLIQNVVDDLRDLFREEVALARAEIRQEVSAWSSAAISMAAGGAVAAVGALFILLGIAQGIAMLFGWPAWGGYLLIGVLLAIGGGVAVLAGRRRTQTIPTLPRTTETVKEATEWMKDRMSSKPQ